MNYPLFLGVLPLVLCVCPSAWSQEASPNPTPFKERVIDPVAIGGPKPIDQGDAKGIQPSVPLPSNYTLAWNQDFTQPSYNPFNVPSNVTANGPCGPGGSIWAANNFNFANTRYTGTEGDPFSTAKGYLNIHANGNGSPPYGGGLNSTDPNKLGFHAKNAYWESKILLPAGGSSQWPAFWLFGDAVDPDTNQRGEVDIMERGYQIPGTTNGASQIHLHVWPGGTSAGDYTINSLSVTPGGWHIFGCLIQSGTVSIYLDRNLIHTFQVSGAFNVPMRAIFNFVFGPGFPTSDCTSGDMGVQYVRCWVPQ
jgi:hypothetical protein